MELCHRCGEDAVTVHLHWSEPGWFARVRRISKCRLRKIPGCGSCQTILTATKDQAERAWNLLHGQRVELTLARRKQG